MADSNDRRSPFPLTDDRSSASGEDRKRRFRKTIEVTRSTRYTATFEQHGGEPGNDSIGMVISSGAGGNGDQFSTSFAVMDSGLGSLVETASDGKRKYTEACYEHADSYLNRLDNIETNLEEQVTIGRNKCQMLEEQLANEREAARESMLAVLESTRKKRMQREKILKRLLEL